MTSFSALAAKLEKRVAVVSDAANADKKEAARAVLADLVLVTPVDTSRAVSNWQIGVGVKPESELAPYFPGRRGSTAELSSNTALSVGLSKIEQVQPGQPIFISNLTPYIGELDSGSSRQFAGGFRARATIVAKNAIGGAV